MTGEGSSSDLLAPLLTWITANAGWIIFLSVAFFVVSLVVVRMLILRLPADYFLQKSHDPAPDRAPGAALAKKVARNVLGVLVIMIGLVLSLPGVPGQGILTLLIGLTLTDFPGKRRMELWFLRKPVILRGINSMRERAGKPPIELPVDTGAEGEGGRHD